jgi:O-antigen/teichoic acid export membrane protein
MIGNTMETPPVAAVKQHVSFFKQSGWLMVANVIGGLVMCAVHFLSKRIPAGEYGSFGVFLAVIMILPTMPLQMILAQQTAKALANHHEGELSGLIRRTWLGTFLIWLVGAILVLAFQKTILERWQMTDPVGLWVTLPIVLFALWLPLFSGVLQGQQNFLWLGWSMLTNGFVRFAAAAVAVLVFQAYAAGMMGGVLLSTMAAVGIAVWQSRALWLTPPKPFDGSGLVGQVIPLTLGFLGFQILFTADTMFVKAWFSEEDAGFYVSAGTLSRALMWLVLPLAHVMFPRIVHSAAKSEKNNLMGMVLLGTGILSVVGAVGLSLLGPLVVRIVFKESYVAVATAVLPWYAAAMVPLAMANVLLNNLLARPASKLIPALCILGVAIGYMIALTQFHGSLVTVLKVLGVFNTLLFLVCAWFTWGVKEVPKQ